MIFCGAELIFYVTQDKIKTLNLEPRGYVVDKVDSRTVRNKTARKVVKFL